MKVVILAGGLGTRLAEKTGVIPKPMVEIGGKPILWHIMKIYSYYGYNDFVLALGYKGEIIKDYFLNFHSLQSNFTINLSNGKIDILNQQTQANWSITLIDTGMDTLTGGRIKRLEPVIGKEPFMLTYGDGVCDINIKSLVDFHMTHGKLATTTAVHPKAHYGELKIENDSIVEFREKPQFRQSWINGGFMVLQPGVFDLIKGDDCIFEREPMEKLSDSNQLMAYKHDGFWQCMDTIRDVNFLNDLYQQGNPPWMK